MRGNYGKSGNLSKDNFRVGAAFFASLRATYYFVDVST
jgi:hypothetical protein